jgi:hypothetical protein
MKTITHLFAFFVFLVGCRAGAEPAARFRTVLTLNGEDEAKETHAFTVCAHWRITCTCEELGPGMTVQVIAVPHPGLHNDVVLDESRPGRKSVYLRNPGTFHLAVFGFSAHWRVVVEEELPR